MNQSDQLDLGRSNPSDLLPALEQDALVNCSRATLRSEEPVQNQYS